MSFSIALAQRTSVPESVYNGIDPHVVRGCKILDAALGTPNWDIEIDRSSLSLKSSSLCILGQTFNFPERCVCCWDDDETRRLPMGIAFRAGVVREDVVKYGDPGFSVGDYFLTEWARDNPEVLREIDGRYYPSYYGFDACNGIRGRGEDVLYCLDSPHMRISYPALENTWRDVLDARISWGKER